MEAKAIDDALDPFALLMATRLISPARRNSSGDRLAMLPKLEKASRLLSKAGWVLVEQLDLVAEANADLDPAALWAAVTDQAGATKEQVLAALDSVEELVPDDDGAAEAALRAALVDKYNTVRPFLKLLGESQALGAAAGGRKGLAAVRRLPDLACRISVRRPPMWARATSRGRSWPTRRATSSTSSPRADADPLHPRVVQRLLGDAASKPFAEYSISRRRESREWLRDNSGYQARSNGYRELGITPPARTVRFLVIWQLVEWGR